MRDAIGREPASFLDDGLTTTTHQRIPQRPRRRCAWGDVCSRSHAKPVHKETSYVAVRSR